jgi:hypothetical protein
LFNFKEKNIMKKFILFSVMAVFTMCLMAQIPAVSKITQTFTIEQGKAVSFNTNYADTLKSGDTLFFIIPVEHKDYVYPYITQYWKFVAVDTTVLVTFWQSMTGSQTVDAEWYQINNTTTLPVTLSAYAKTVTATSGNAADYSFKEEMAWFDSRYLGIRYIARVKTGFKSCPYGTVKFPY